MTTIYIPPPPLEQILKGVAHNIAWSGQCKITIIIEGPGSDHSTMVFDHRRKRPEPQHGNE